MMNFRKALIFKVLTNRFHPRDGQEFLDFLPAGEKKAILANPVQGKDLVPLILQDRTTLERMHYSWIKPLLRAFPSKIIPHLISSLTQEQQAGFKSHSLPKSQLSPPIRLFFQKKLYQSLGGENRLPVELLPRTSFYDLLQWPKHDLILLADFLGMYDLAAEVRRIVNKEQLKTIYTCLSPKQFYYLKTCLQKKDKLASPSLGIDPANIETEHLKQAVHRRGLVRLAGALCGEHPDFVWYVAHRFDSGRGQIILNHYKEQPVPSVTSVLQQQVMDVIHFLKSE